MSKYLTIVDNENQNLLLICGHPGSGKSKLAKFYTLHTGAKHFENDAFFTNEKGEYHFRLEDHQKAKDDCFKKMETALKAGHSVVVANTFTTMSEKQPYLDAAKALGIPVQVVEMELTGFDSVHNVPASVILDKIKKFEPYPGALRVTHENYELYSVQEKGPVIDIIWNMDSRYNFNYSTPKHLVKEMLDDLNVIIDVYKNDVAEAKLNGDPDEVENREFDLSEFLKLKEALYSGDLSRVKKVISSMDTAVRDVLPLHITFMQKDTNPYCVWSNMDLKREEVLRIIDLYKEIPSNGKAMDEMFTADFFKGLKSVLDLSSKKTPVMKF